MPVAVLVHLRHFYRDHHNHHHHHHHHHHYCSLYLCNDQKIWITTKIHIFTKGFKHIECGRFLRDHAGFHEHNEPRVVLYKLWHDLINSHKVTKHACTFSCLPLTTQCTTYTMTLQLWTNNKTNKSYKQLIYIYINMSCKCDTNRAGHLTLDAYASRPVACLLFWHITRYITDWFDWGRPLEAWQEKLIWQDNSAVDSFLTLNEVWPNCCYFTDNLSNGFDWTKIIIFIKVSLKFAPKDSVDYKDSHTVIVFFNFDCCISF